MSKSEDVWKVSNVDRRYRCESIDGIKLSVYKSAIQKYMRRNKCGKGLGTLRLMSNFNDGSDEGNKIVSNIVNRMIAMMSEDVGISNATLPIKMRILYEKFLEVRNYNYLYIMYKELCISNKCRLLSDLKSTYNLMPYYLKDMKKLKSLHKKIICEEQVPLCNMYDMNMTEEETLKKIDQCLKVKSYDVFVYVSHYMLRDYISGRGGLKIWNVIMNNASEEVVDIVEALKYFYTKMTHKEKYLYIYQSILTILHESTLDLEISRYEKITSEDFKYPLKDHKFPDYVYDIHTGNKEKGVLDFAMEGAYIVGEDTTYINQRWRENYIKFKKLLEGKETEEKRLPELTKEYMFECIRGQKLTSYTKPFVYIPTGEKYVNMVGYVYKGPYDKMSKRNIIIEWRVKILRELGTKNVMLPRIIDQKDSVWYEYKYIGDPNKIEYKEEHDNISNTDVKIIDREKSGIRQFSKISEEEVYGYIIGERMIMSLIDLVILGVGDMGYYNMLLSYDNVPWIIDIEDTRSEEEDKEKPIEKSILTKISKLNAEILKRCIKEKREEIKNHLIERKKIDWEKWSDYWKYVGKDPIKIIESMMAKM